jgi:uncharacterized protein DUF3572
VRQRVNDALSTGRASAEALAITALGFLAGDPERLSRFLALSGLGPGNLREAAAEPSFLLAVLDHLAGDERLLVAFATEQGVDPSAVAAAREALAGGPADFSP